MPPPASGLPSRCGERRRIARRACLTPIFEVGERPQRRSPHDPFGRTSPPTRPHRGGHPRSTIPNSPSRGSRRWSLKFGRWTVWAPRLVRSGSNSWASSTAITSQWRWSVASSRFLHDRSATPAPGGDALLLLARRRRPPCPTLASRWQPDGVGAASAVFFPGRFAWDEGSLARDRAGRPRDL